MHADRPSEAERLTKAHRCKEHPGLQLVYKPDRFNGGFRIVCNTCEDKGWPQEFEKRKTQHQMWRENPESVPLHTANVYAKIHRDEIEQMAGALPDELGDAVRRKYLPQTGAERSRSTEREG